MKYVILIHSNPQPWGHPTSDYLPEFQDLPETDQKRLVGAFEARLTELHERGELVNGAALGDPTAAHLYRWADDGRTLATDGPYSEAKEHLAGFFLIDVESPERAEEIVADFVGPGETIELRPVMSVGGDEG